MGKTNRPRGAPRPRKPLPKTRAGGRSPAIVATFVAVAVLAAAIIGFAVYATTRGDNSQPSPPAAAIPGLIDYRVTEPQMLTRSHVTGTVTYPVKPPAGGNHNPIWQNCDGNVYPAAIANENAVHSLEHGAVWITYRPGQPADQIAALAGKVTGTPYLMMSPFPGLDQPISLQAWGLQLKVDNAADPRTDQFIRDFRITAAPEPAASCTGGVTATGTTPHNTPGG